MNTPNTKSSDELQREVRDQLRTVKRDLNEMEGRMTPGQIIDDAIFYPHGRNPAQTLEHLKRNPVGTTFLSLGTLMLMEDESHQSMEANARVKLNQAKHRLTDLKDHVKNQMPHRELEPGTAPNMADIAKGKVSHMKESFQSKISDIKRGIDDKIPSRQELKDTLQTKVTDLKEGVSSQVDHLKEGVNSKVETLREGVSSKVESFQSQMPDSDEFRSEGFELKDELQSQIDTGVEKAKNLDPMTYMALGAGLGALTGASLPVTEAEQRFVDDKLHDRLTSFNQDLQSAINECTSILKDLVLTDAKNFNVNLFR